jgi:hypothetical protein
MASVLFPLYVYPADKGAAWAPILDGVKAVPSAKILVVVNPSNGPGIKVDPNYESGIGLLTAAGISMAGYVYTKYGSRPSQAVEEDVSAWSQLYPQVTGIFVDNMSNKPGLEGYYSELTGRAKSLGFKMVMGNPGTQVPRTYLGTVDSTIVYENAGYPTSVKALDPQGWYAANSASIGMIAHDVQKLDVRFVQRAAQLAQYICVTESYHSIPPYFAEMLSGLSQTPG